MPIDIIILPQGGTLYTSPWREQECWRKQGGYDFQIEEWRNHILSLSSQALSGNCIQTAVFLCLLGDHLVDRFDYHLIRELLKVARDHSWGANIYMVKDYHIRVSASQIQAHYALSNWFDSVLEAGGTDVIEVPIDRSGFTTIDAKPLRIGSDLSRQRHELLQLMILDGGWKCFLPESTTGLFSFLDPFVEYTENPAYDGNLIIVIDKSNSLDQVTMARDALHRYPKANSAVVMFGYNIKASPKLRELCYNHGLRLIQCRGPFELRFFLLRLNKTSLKRNVGQKGKTEIVTLDVDPIFDLKRSISSPSLLITNAFHHHDDLEHCLEASKDAGCITLKSPPNTKYYIHPSLDGHSLPSVLKELDSLTAWVYLGHGDGDNGLQVASSGKIEGSEVWLSRFSGYGKTLPLVIFSACRSASIARRFAQAGVGVAIGFEEDVPPQACRMIATEVVQAALLTNGDCQEILKAFHNGCADLLASGYLKTGPIAFYSES